MEINYDNLQGRAIDNRHSECEDTNSSEACTMNITPISEFDTSKVENLNGNNKLHFNKYVKNAEAYFENKTFVPKNNDETNMKINEYFEKSCAQTGDDSTGNGNLKSNVKNSVRNNLHKRNENKKDGEFNENSLAPNSVIKKKDSLLIDEDTICGFGSLKPAWLQKWTTARVYVFLFSILGILHESYNTYLVGVLSTLEKRFSFENKISGSIMMADEIIPLLFGVIIGYYGGKAHRPRLLAIGMILSAGCCFATSLPYFLFGSVQHLTLLNVKNQTGPEYCDGKITPEACDNGDRPPTLLAVMLLILGSFLKGFGKLAYYAIGLVYMDDNSKIKNTPVYLAISLAFRLFGPLVGFLMSSAFLKFYENPFEDPGIGPEDPRWIGAWWMGFLLQGVLLLIFTIPIAMFPRRLPNQTKTNHNPADAKEETIKELFLGLLAALKRLGKNPFYIIFILNTTMTIFGHFGHYIMLPKYMENQFKLSASDASLLSGPPPIVSIMISTVIGGFILWKYRPRPKIILAGMIASEMLLAVGFLILTIPRCQNAEISHFGKNEDGLILDSLCNKNCDCSTTAFTPFCNAESSTVYFSPCYAGCTLQENSSLSTEPKAFGNCSCVSGSLDQTGGNITEGFCLDEECWPKTLTYIILLLIMSTISNIFMVAHTMILLRSVHPDDKGVALGTFEAFICLFGFIPYPVTYGALVDSACLIWETNCGETGNCWFYDIEKYNYLLHGASSLFSLLSTFCLITMYFLSGRIRNLYDEDEMGFDKPIKLDTVSDYITKL